MTFLGVIKYSDVDDIVYTLQTTKRTGFTLVIVDTCVTL